jgi:zinc transport system permease protein
LGCLLTGIICGLVGTYIVTRRMVFIAGGMAHASLGGVGLCALAGAQPMAGAALFALFTGYSVQALSQRREIREDSVIAMLWALGMSIGVMCTFLSPKFIPSLSGYLFGNVLFVTRADLIALAIVAVATTAFFYLFLPQIVAIAFDRQFLAAQKVRVNLLEYAMITLIALAIVSCLRIVGIVMVISLLSIPQMTANLLTQRFGRMAVLSILFSIVSCLAGLAGSYWLNVPSGATIVMVSILIYIVVRTIKRLGRGFSNR